MKDGERISREVLIANRTYPLKIHSQDEDKVIKIVQAINQKIDQLRGIYDARDNQDYLAMCLLQMSIQHASHQPSASPDIEADLSRIEALLA